MQRITIEDAQIQLSALIDAAINGETIVVVKNAQEEILFMPVSKSPKLRQLGTGIGQFSISDDFDEPLEDFNEYMA